MACMEKLNVMNSQIGRSPAMAAPTAIPAKPISVIGVSMTRLSPYFFHKPLETCSNNSNIHLQLTDISSNISLSNDNRMQRTIYTLIRNRDQISTILEHFFLLIDAWLLSVNACVVNDTYTHHIHEKFN